jgi:3',5'-cyclic AMP phosphodiesterase CpdA
MDHKTSRREALRCMGIGAGTLFTLSGGILTATGLADAALAATTGKQLGTPLFLQISDTHIGFNKAANPDVNGTLGKAIAYVNSMPVPPAFAIHTGDITHLSKPEEFDTAAQLLSNLRITELHTTPGEHDVTDGIGTEYFNRFGKPSGNKGYYSFDHEGVHFVALVNVMNFKPNGLGGLGDEQIAWLKNDLNGRSASQPLVLFAHMPMWTIYEPWGWGTGDADQVMALVRRFGSVTVLNGHIHQIVQKVEGNITFHTARSTAYPQPAPGVGPGPGPLAVPADQLPSMLGVTTVSEVRLSHTLALSDSTLA